MRTLTVLEAAAGVPVTGTTKASAVGVSGKCVFLLAYTKGAETSLAVGLNVLGSDGVEHELYTTGGSLYSPFGTLSASLATPRAVPVLLGAFEGLPDCLFVPYVTIVGSPSGTSAYRLELVAQ